MSPRTAAEVSPDDVSAPVRRSSRVDAREIRAAALRLFADRGYRATTMADIGAEVGMRGPSLYRHLRSKQELLVSIMVETMDTLISAQTAARQAGGSCLVQLRRMVEAHVRYHAANREQAFVGNREIDNLEEPNRERVLQLRREYENGLRQIISEGIQSGEFTEANARLVSFAILDMGMGVAAWFRADGPDSVHQVAYTHAEFAVAMLQKGMGEGQ